MINCRCHEFGHKDRRLLESFNNLSINIHKTAKPEPNKTTLVVSGTRCTLCDTLNLSRESHRAFMGRFSAIKGLYERFKTVIVTDAEKNMRYDASISPAEKVVTNDS